MSDLLKLSVSKTKTFIDCKAKYNYVYNFHMPRKTWSYHTIGHFCHKVLEDFHKTYIQGCLLPYNIVMSDVYKDAVIEYKDKMTPEMRKECWDMIDQYLRLITANKKNNIQANVIACEKTFSFPVDDKIILNGMIDRVQIDDDNVLHVCDYKTTKNKKYLKNDFFQLVTYALVLLHEDPTITKVRASYILLRHNFEYITTEFSIDEIMEVKGKYLAYAEQIMNEKEFPANVTRLCEYCDSRDYCSGYSAANKMNQKFGEVSW